MDFLRGGYELMTVHVLVEFPKLISGNFDCGSRKRCRLKVRLLASQQRNGKLVKVGERSMMSMFLMIC